MGYTEIGYDAAQVATETGKIQRGLEGLPEVTEVKRYHGTETPTTYDFHQTVRSTAYQLASMTQSLAIYLKDLKEAVQKVVDTLAETDQVAADRAMQLLKNIDEAADAADVVSATAPTPAPPPQPKGRNAIV